MGAKPSYDELEQRIHALEQEVFAHRELEKALREKDERYNELFENATHIILTIDPDGRFLEVNKKWKETFGYHEDELATITLWDIIHPDSLASCREVFEMVLSGETTPNMENIFISKRGEPIPVEGSIYCHMEHDKPKAVRGIFHAIHKRKKSEEALRKSEEIARTLLTANTDPAFLTDLGGVVIATNHFGALRVGKKMYEFIGQCAWDFLPPELSDTAKAVVNEVVRSGKPVDYEEEFLGHFYYNSLYPVFDSEGKVERLAFFARDITHLKKAEQALAESEERYRSVFENTATAMAIIERDMIISMVNSEFEKLTGYSKEQVEGKMKWTGLVAEEDLERMKGYHTRRREGDQDAPREYEFRLVDRQGCVKDIFLRVDMIPGTDKSITSLLDITARKKATQALRESEEKYRLLVENANDAIFIAQDQGIKFHNPKTEALTGYSAEELAKIPFGNLIHPEDRALVLERHLKRIKGEKLISTYSFRILNREGEELWVDLSTVLITWEGKPATLNFLRDITLQKRIEVQLLQAQKMEAVGTLAGGIAHDFNNLLMGIQGNASLMLLNTDNRSSHYEKLKNIEEYVQNGADLTKQLLGFARGGKYEVKPANLNEIIKKSAEMFGRTKKEIVMHKKYEKEIWTAEVDRRQIEQVLLNLYVNAWQAMPGGGEMYLETQNVVLHGQDVEPFGVASGRYVKISVTDTGVGMDESTRVRIFDPFFTTKEMGRGTGLGLASAYGIIHSHRGIIQVFSKRGQGSKFDIYLPASEKQIMERRDAPTDVLKGKGTILFVDDEAMIIDVVQQMLHSLGYKVLAAKGGVEALKIYRENQDQISMVILDMVMPGLSGGETYDSLKEINPAVKVLLSSGYSIDGQANEIMDRGCHGFIQKPFNLKDLAKKVQEILDKK